MPEKGEWGCTERAWNETHKKLKYQVRRVAQTLV